MKPDPVTNPATDLAISVERTAWRGWLDAAADPAVDRELRQFFDRLDAAVAERGPTCWLSGKCCHFESYGHRLYVTALEIAWLIRQLDETGRDRLNAADLPGMDGCPFQSNGMCSVHPLRPLGCRIYFCDPDAQDWQEPLYEQCLNELRQLHEARGIEYRYLEWRAGLAEARTALKIPTD